MQKNFKLIIEYDGTDFFGWQRQKSQRTVQGELEKKLEIMLQSPVSLIGSGRTDTGVHALGQTANFRCETTLTPVQFLKGLNSLLDGDIVIHSCEEVPISFHAQYDAVRKCYQYRILNRPIPSAVLRRYSWFIHKPLKLDAMSSALPLLIGRHDFKSFESTGSPRTHTIRHVFHASLSSEPDGMIVFDIEANGFLRCMVRNIVGTLVEIGFEKLAPEYISNLIEAKNRKCAGPTAPPQGLFLKQVLYEGEDTITDYCFRSCDLTRERRCHL